MSNTKILAKLETRQSLLNFQGILAEADGIIISRGQQVVVSLFATLPELVSCDPLLCLKWL